MCVSSSQVGTIACADEWKSPPMLSFSVLIIVVRITPAPPPPTLPWLSPLEEPTDIQVAIKLLPLTKLGLLGRPPLTLRPPLALPEIGCDAGAATVADTVVPELGGG